MKMVPCDECGGDGKCRLCEGSAKCNLCEGSGQMEPEEPFFHYPGPPPFDLVQLHTLPLDQWKGRAVFHPMSQQGDTAHWLAEDDPYFHAEAEMFEGTLIPPDKKGPSYDVGIVVEWEADNWRQEPDNPGAHEVTFLTGDGGSLHYGAYNLWTPKPT